MKKRFIKGILNCSQVFSAVIAVLTSATVTLFFNGFNWNIILSLLFVIAAICMIVYLLDVCALYKRIEFGLKWDNKQPVDNPSANKEDKEAPKEQIQSLHEDTLRYVMDEMGKWKVEYDADEQVREKKMTDFENSILIRTLLVVLAILIAATFTVRGVAQINQETEQARVETFNNALDKNWIQTQNKMDSLMKSITDFESEMNAGLDSLEVRIKGIKKEKGK